MKFKLVAALSLCLLSFSSVYAERVRYDNYRLYAATPNTSSQLTALRTLPADSETLILLHSVRQLNQQVPIIVAPQKLHGFLGFLDHYGIQHNVLRDDIQSLIDEDYKMVAPRSAHHYSWQRYHLLDDTYAWMKNLAKRNPKEVTYIKAGKTYEGRDIAGVRISYDNGKHRKPGIFLEAGIHAREWIAPATANYIIYQLLSSKQEDIMEIARNYDWYIFPHTNPDGYVFTHTKQRFWRRSRKPYGNCIGVDLNRNWDYKWMTAGASNDSCRDGEIYAGPAPFSEIETRTLSNYILSLKGKIQLFISFHSYGQYLLYPYGWSRDLKPSNQADYEQVARATLQALSKRYGTKYTSGNVASTLYPAAGASIDWAHGAANISMSFTFELTPNMDAIGFILPAKRIKATGEETLDSLVGMVNEVEKLGYFDL